MKHIAIIGAGGIGQRHAQSCATLPAADYHLHLVEPNADSQARTAALLGDRAAVTWYAQLADLPQAPDIAVVATRADIRAPIVRALVDEKAARSLILEKVLFQRIADFATIARVLDEGRVATWVNCPRRMWPAYRQLRDRLKGEAIASIEMLGAHWDIGCNAIHFIDLIAFLTGTGTLVVDDIRLGDVRPAKRPGMLHIEGIVSGHVVRGAAPMPFSVASIPAHSGPQTIRIALAQGTVEVVEDAAVMSITWPDGTRSTAPIPFQSQLTASAVQSIATTGDCDLASYAESRALHETFIAAMLTALHRAGKCTDSDVCPIT